MTSPHSCRATATADGDQRDPLALRRAGRVEILGPVPVRARAEQVGHALWVPAGRRGGAVRRRPRVRVPFRLSVRARRRPPARRRAGRTVERLQTGARQGRCLVRVYSVMPGG